MINGFLIPGSNKNWFAIYQSLNRGKVLLSNHASCKVVGISTIKIKIFGRIVRTLTDVRYVLDLRKNLILVGTLESKGYTYKGEGGAIRVSNGMALLL